LVLLAAFVGKFGGCAASGLLTGLSRREALMVGVMMNTRALMELIVINLGYELGLINRSVFFMLVFMAVVTTYVTAPLLRRLVRKTELEPYYQVSAFVQEMGAFGRPRVDREDRVSTWECGQPSNLQRSGLTGTNQGGGTIQELPGDAAPPKPWRSGRESMAKLDREC
jgi:hypothetical protein